MRRASSNSAAIDLLKRIREWDHLPLTGDGPYWMREIDKVLADAIPKRVASHTCGKPDDDGPWFDPNCKACLVSHATPNRVTADVAADTARWNEIREVAAELIRQGTHDPAEVIENAMKDGVDIATHIIKGTLPDGW